MARYIEELVGRQVRRSELAREKRHETGGACANPVITISRRMGSGARVVAEMLANELGWSLWDKDLIEAIAKDADVSKRVVEAFDERTMSEIEAFTRSVLGDFEMGSFMYKRYLARAVGVIVKLGNAIILGRGADFLIPGALNVRIDASDETRVKNMMAYENLNKEQAINKLRQSDRYRHEYLVRTFGKDAIKNARYDITIWMDEFRPEDAVEIIKTTLKVWCSRNA